MRLRGRPAAGVATILIASAAALAACGSAAADNASQACGHVDLSLSYYTASGKAEAAHDTRLARADASRALSELRLALPLASIATEDNGTWQPLMATLSESSRVPEKNLVNALRAQCAGVATSGSS